MKKNILLLFFFTLTIVAQENWIQLSTPTKKNLKTLAVADSLHLFAAGDSGTIIRSSNGGIDWQILSFPSSLPIIDIYFSSFTKGWVVTRNVSSMPFGSMVYITSDAGNSWQESSRFLEDIFITTITFIDTNYGWCGSAEGGLLKTYDGGVNWDAVDDSVVTGLPIYSLQFISGQRGYGSGGHIDFAGGIFSSNDSGNTWKLQLVGPEPIQNLHIFDSLNIIGVGGDYEFGTGVVITTDGGVNWIYKSLSFFGIAVAVNFRNRFDGWATLGFGQSFMRTTDAGKRWNLIPTPNNISIYDIAFTAEKYGYAVGDSGSVLKYVHNPVSVEDNNIFVSEFKLFQNYPNPFNPSTVISYQFSASSNVTLKIYDILGNEVATLIDNEWKEAGFYNFQLIINNYQLTTGVYFYRLQAGEFTATKKFVLMK